MKIGPCRPARYRHAPGCAAGAFLLRCPCPVVEDLDLDIATAKCRFQEHDTLARFTAPLALCRGSSRPCTMALRIRCPRASVASSVSAESSGVSPPRFSNRTSFPVPNAFIVHQALESREDGFQRNRSEVPNLLLQMIEDLVEFALGFLGSSPGFDVGFEIAGASRIEGGALGDSVPERVAGDDQASRGLEQPVESVEADAGAGFSSVCLGRGGLRAGTEFGRAAPSDPSSVVDSRAALPSSRLNRSSPARSGARSGLSGCKPIDKVLELVGEPLKAGEAHHARVSLESVELAPDFAEGRLATFGAAFDSREQRNLDASQPLFRL